MFAHDGRPFLHYFSRAWITDDEGNASAPVRSRPASSDRGGEASRAGARAPDGLRRDLVRRGRRSPDHAATDVVARTDSAKEYTAGQRMYGLVDGDLMYAFDMAAEGQELQSHLWGRLKRV